MQTNASLQARALALIETLRQHLARADLVARHRRRATDFVRERKLIFPIVMLLILQKSLKSLQTHLHELFWALGPHGRRDIRETTMPMDGGIGASSKRREDVRFLTGKGRYTDDINRPGQAYVHFLRSDVAHGRMIGAP